MATPGPGLSLASAEYAAALLAQREVRPRARAMCDHIGQLFTDAALVVYVVDYSGEPCWKPVAEEGQIELSEPTVPFTYGTLGTIAEEKQVMVFGAEDLAREEYAHLNLRRSFHSLAYLPIS